MYNLLTEARHIKDTYNITTGSLITSEEFYVLNLIG